MNDEAAFLRAIALAPEDDTTRLVFADWQDDYGDPARATVLRLDYVFRTDQSSERFECAGSPTDAPLAVKRYPPLLSQLTETAERLPVEWLGAATRLGWEIQSLAERFAARVPGTQVISGDADRGNEWRAVIARLKQMFQSHVGEAVVRDRFSVPVDYALFATTVGGLACLDEYGMSFFDALYGSAEMADRTESFCDMYAQMHDEKEHLASCGLWLFIGFRDKHDLHLCCDRVSPLFGVVADLHDSHPWISPPHGPVSWEVVAHGFLDYLRLQVAKAEQERME